MEIEEPNRPRHSTAFILDDEPRVGALVRKQLIAAGLEARPFTDPIEFLEQVRISNPDLIVLDLALGKTDAVEIIRQLDVLRFGGCLLLISGRDETTLLEIEQIGRAHGLVMLRSLPKPFRSADLKERLQSSLREVSMTSEVKKQTAIPLPGEPSMDLQAALQNDRLELWYQPKIDLRSLSVCGAEALIRARDEHGRIIPPSHLLPPAGDPLYKPLSLFVLDRAMQDWVFLAKQGWPLKIAVNVPTSVLNAPDFVPLVREFIPTDHRFPGLVVEVTEDEIVRDPQWIREVATQLRLYKTSVSIDDFGAAYAFLSRLTDFPFNELKLDRGFVSNCGWDALKRGLCQTVADLAHRFGASACAEGVETEDDLKCLQALGFDTAQGFLFARPMPFNELLTFLVAGPKWNISLAKSGPASSRNIR